MLRKGKVLVISFFCLTSLVYGQSWKDSLQLGINAYKNGDYLSALQKIISAQRLAPDEINLAGDIGTAAYRAGDYETAETAFKAFNSQEISEKEQAKLFHNKGNSQFKQQNYNEAIESYKQALKLDPTNDSSRYNLAMAMRKLMQQEQQEQENQQQSDSNQEDENDQDGNANDSESGEDEEPNVSPDKESNNSDKNEDTNNESPQPTNLSDKRKERILDELTKKELETKQRVLEREAKQRRQGAANSGKNW